MLQKVSKQVRECLRRAEECGQRAKIEPDPNAAKDFLDMERRWLSLARSYQFSEQLETFSDHNKEQRTTGRRGRHPRPHGKQGLE